MALTEEQLEHFFREGYVLAPGLVPVEAVRSVLEAAPTEANDSGGWQARVFSHDEPDKDAKIHRLLIEPSVVEAAQSIFGTPPRVYYGMLAIVPAHGGTGLPWHQDNQYTHLVGGAINIFIALSEITPDKANLWVAPRSHLLGRQPSQDSRLYGGGHREAVIEPENAMPLPTLRPGDACLFDRNMLHRSLKNETAEHRFAYAGQYQSENTRLAETGKKDPKKMLATVLRQRWLSQGLLD